MAGNRNPINLGQRGFSYGFRAPQAPQTVGGADLASLLQQAQTQGPPQDDFRRDARNYAMADVLSNQPTVESGSVAEALAEALAGGIRGRALRGERERELTSEAEQRSLAQALADREYKTGIQQHADTVDFRNRDLAADTDYRTQSLGLQRDQLELTRRGQDLDYRASLASAGRGNADDIRQDQRFAAQLRNQFQTRHNDFMARRDSYSMLRSLQDGSGDSDIAFIYTYMKMLDPTSVVREGEFATAQNAGGVPESIRNQYNRVMEGRTTLPASVRRGMVDTARRIYETSAEQFERDRQMQSEMAASMGGNIDPNFVAPDLRLPPEALMTDEELEQIANGGQRQPPPPRAPASSPWDNARSFWGMSRREGR